MSQALGSEQKMRTNMNVVGLISGCLLLSTQCRDERKRRSRIDGARGLDDDVDWRTT